MLIFKTKSWCEVEGWPKSLMRRGLHECHNNTKLQAEIYRRVAVMIVSSKRKLVYEG